MTRRHVSGVLYRQDLYDFSPDWQWNLYDSSKPKAKWTSLSNKPGKQYNPARRFYNFRIFTDTNLIPASSYFTLCHRVHDSQVQCFTKCLTWNPRLSWESQRFCEEIGGQQCRLNVLLHHKSDSEVKTMAPWENSLIIMSHSLKIIYPDEEANTKK